MPSSVGIFKFQVINLTEGHTSSRHRTEKSAKRQLSMWRRKTPECRYVAAPIPCDLVQADRILAKEYLRGDHDAEILSQNAASELTQPRASENSPPSKSPLADMRQL